MIEGDSAASGACSGPFRPNEPAPPATGSGRLPGRAARTAGASIKLNPSPSISFHVSAEGPVSGTPVPSARGAHLQGSMGPVACGDGTRPFPPIFYL